jgi:hypothetical protein
MRGSGGGGCPWFSAWCHPFMWRRRRLNGAALRMRPWKPRPCVTAGLCGKIKIPSRSKALDLLIQWHKKWHRIINLQAHFFTSYTERNYPKAINFMEKGVTFLCRMLNVGAYFYVEKWPPGSLFYGIIFLQPTQRKMTPRPWILMTPRP